MSCPQQKTLLCLTCHQPVPAGEDYPGFFGQHRITPDFMNVDEASEELEVVLDYLKAVCEVLPEARHVGDGTMLELVHLAGALTQEAQRRAEWLYEAGNAATASGKEG